MKVISGRTEHIKQMGTLIDKMSKTGTYSTKLQYTGHQYMKYEIKYLFR